MRRSSRTAAPRLRPFQAPLTRGSGANLRISNNLPLSSGMHEPARAFQQVCGSGAGPAPPSHSKSRRSSLTNDILTTRVHEAVEALQVLREEQGRLTPADLAEAVQTHELDEREAEQLSAELE